MSGCEVSVLVRIDRCAEHHRPSLVQRRSEQRPDPGAKPRRSVPPLLSRRFQHASGFSSEASGSVTAVAATSAACALDQLQRRGAPRAAAECPRRRRRVECAASAERCMRVAANGVRCSSACWCSGSGVASATFNSAARWLGCGCSAEAAAQASARRGEAKRGGVVKSAPGVCSGCVSRARL